MSTIATLLSGLGLFFIGVRALSANLVPLVGRRARTLFAWALGGPVGAALSGAVAGLVTQSATAVSWIIVGFLRAGILPSGPALVAPSWAFLGTAMLPLLVAIDTSMAADIVIGVAGIAIYFKLARTDRLRHMVEAALGAALLLFGMHIISTTVGPLRDSLMQNVGLAKMLHSPWLLVVVGAGFSFAAQSSAVAAAIAVAAVGAGLLTVPDALPLIVGANAASIVNNLLLVPGETGDGRLVFVFQSVQKAAGSLFLAGVAAYTARSPAAAEMVAGLAGHSVSGQVAIVFAIAQAVGALFTSLTAGPVAALMRRLAPPGEGETLAQPVFLLREALNDPPAALDLAMRELARLSERLPLLLDRVRAEPQRTTPPVEILRSAGATLAAAIREYLRSLLDHQPRQAEVAAALLLEDATGNAGALHETLAELVEMVPQAAMLPTTGNLVEALHTLLTVVAGHAESFGTEDPALALDLLGQRDQLMEELRLRLAAGAESPVGVQDALFRMTILFERAVWLARRLVLDMSQAQRALAAD
jgi:phosphate:Na+ symporter